MAVVSPARTDAAALTLTAAAEGSARALSFARSAFRPSRCRGRGTTLFAADPSLIINFPAVHTPAVFIAAGYYRRTFKVLPPVVPAGPKRCHRRGGWAARHRWPRRRATLRSRIAVGVVVVVVAVVVVVIISVAATVCGRQRLTSVGRAPTAVSCTSRNYISGSR